MYLKLREYCNSRLKEVNHLNWQLIADHNERPKSYTIIRRFLFKLVGTVSLDRNYREVINLLFVLPISFYSNILKTGEILQFLGRKKFSTCLTLSFQRKRLKIAPATDCGP